MPRSACGSGRVRPPPGASPTRPGACRRSCTSPRPRRRGGWSGGCRRRPSAPGRPARAASRGRPAGTWRGGRSRAGPDQRGDGLIEEARIDGAAVDQGDVTLWVDEEVLRKAGHPVGVLAIVAPRLVELRIGEPVSMDEFEGMVGRVIEIDAEHGEGMRLILPLKLLEVRRLGLARPTP